MIEHDACAPSASRGCRPPLVVPEGMKTMSHLVMPEGRETRSASDYVSHLSGISRIKRVTVKNHETPAQQTAGVTKAGGIVELCKIAILASGFLLPCRNDGASRRPPRVRHRRATLNATVRPTRHAGR